MNQHATVVEEYRAQQKSKRLAGPKRSLARKTLVHDLARVACTEVEDRRTRKKVKTEIYRQVLPILEFHEADLAGLRAYYKKLLGWLTGFCGFALAAMAVAVLYFWPRLF